MNRACSIFAQLLQLFPRDQFQQAVQEHHAERNARGFTCWGQFVAVMFWQLASASWNPGTWALERCGGVFGSCCAGPPCQCRASCLLNDELEGVLRWHSLSANRPHVPTSGVPLAVRAEARQQRSEQQKQ
jgi:hypothetical protein